MTTHVNKNDPRVKRTRQYLKQAFIDLISVKDFESITIQEITNQAGVNRATFYSHFKDKYDLLDETIGELFNDEILRWIDSDTEMNEETLRNLMLGVCHWHLEFRQKCISRAFTFVSHIEAIVKQLLYNIIFSWLQRTEITHLQKHGKMEMIATMISWSIYGITLQWTNEGRAEKAESLVNDAMPFIMASIKVIEYEPLKQRIDSKKKDFET
jgi:AcrR family transcriptional regulator